MAVSLIVLTISVRQQKAETMRQVDLDRSSQARLISGWYDFVSNTGGQLVVQMTIINASQLVVTDVRGYLFEVDGVQRAAFNPVRVQQPGAPGEAYITADGLPPDLELLLAFTDDAGIRWLKYSNPGLIELEPGRDDLAGVMR